MKDTNEAAVEQTTAFEELETRAKHQTLQGCGVASTVDHRQEGWALSVKLGVTGKPLIEDRPAYLLAVDLPPAQSDAADAMQAEIRKAGCVALFERIGRGWVDALPGGGTRTFLTLAAGSTERFDTIVRALPAQYATDGESVIAQLLSDGAADVAPTKIARGDHVNLRSFGEPCPVTPSELYGVGVVIDALSSTRDPATLSIFDIRVNDSLTSQIRDRFNRIANAADAEASLKRHGWEVCGKDDFAASFRHGSRTGTLILDPPVFIDHGEGETEGETTTAYRPFDLLVGLEQKVGTKGALRLMDSATAVADLLMENGTVSAEIEVFRARGKTRVIPSNQNTLDIVTAYADAISTARTVHDAATPLAFRRTVRNVTSGVVSVTSSAEVIRWTRRNIQSLLVGTAQFAKVTTLKDGSTILDQRHSINETIVDSVMMTLNNPGVLNPVEYLASEPLLTRDGQVVQDHGYDIGARAFLAIPARDRSKWKTEYTVPPRPTLDDVRAAYKYLDTELLSDFPYESDADRARHFSYLLTCVGRSLTNGSIAFLANAPDRGTGKSLLLLIGRVLAQGSPRAKSFRFGKVNDPETEKGLVSLLMEDGTFFHCDEIPRGNAVTGDVLTALITAVDGDDTIRILGGNDTVVRAGVVVTGAGNNVKLGADFNRRFFPINLAYTGEGSVLRRNGFRHPDLVKFVQENRTRLLAAAHTILLYGLQNEPAHKIENMGMTHDWAKKILGAMSHIQHESGVTLAELALSGWLESVDDHDQQGQEWGELLYHLWRKALGKPKTAAELAALAIHVNESQGDKSPDLPPGLLGVDHRAKGAGRRWAIELEPILRTRIPYDGIKLSIEQVERAGRTNRAHTYELKCWGADGPLVLAGRDPFDSEAPSTVDRKERPQLGSEWDEFLLAAGDFTRLDDRTAKDICHSLAESVALPAPLRGLDASYWDKALFNVSGQVRRIAELDYRLVYTPGRSGQPNRFRVQATDVSSVRSDLQVSAGAE